MRARFLIAAALAGCTPAGTTPPPAAPNPAAAPRRAEAPSPPAFPYKVGDKVIFPGGIADLYSDPDILRRRAALPSGGWDRLTETEKKVYKDAMIDFLPKGTLLEIIEVHPDIVGVIAIQGPDGSRIDKHGYVRRSDFEGFRP